MWILVLYDDILLTGIYIKWGLLFVSIHMYRVEPLNNGQPFCSLLGGCLIEMYRQLMVKDKQFLLCREVVAFKSVLY